MLKNMIVNLLQSEAIDKVVLMGYSDNELIKTQSKILIVDDNLTNVFLLEQLLKMNGYSNIVTLTDSREVLSTYVNMEPDLILLDLKMPYLDGFQLLELMNLEKKNDYLPVIVITAQSEKENLIKALKLGAKDFIGKPFDGAEVLMRVANMLEIRLLHNATKRDNLLLEVKVKERTKEIQDIQLELVQRLLRAAEFRDNDTGNHIRRIGEFAAALGKLIGLDAEYCNRLFQASMMHDVGKIAIPDSILLKPDKLTDFEMEIMKKHTIKGAEILADSSSEVLRLGEEIALTHHEKWDGSGYPRGLKGAEIPLSGRITAICDVFDALRSERPYKKAWSLEDVIATMKQERGYHFDPSLLDTFMNNLNIFTGIRQNHENKYQLR